MLTVETARRLDGSARRHFWDELHLHGEKQAFFDSSGAGDVVSYRTLSARVAAVAEPLAGSRKLVCVEMDGSFEAIVSYLAALSAGHVVWPYPQQHGGAPGRDLLGPYRPDIVLWRSPALAAHLQSVDYRCTPSSTGPGIGFSPREPHALHPDLALLLTTSGSTGSRKLVRLSYENLIASTENAVAAAELESRDRILQWLPLHHVYGLSLVNAACLVGAAVLLGPRSCLDRAWQDFARSQGATVIPAVPTQLRLLRDSDVGVASLGGLAKLLLAGSALDERSREWLLRDWVPHGVRIYCMYGTTESAGRISVLGPESFVSCPGSVGKAIAGASLEILPSGEICHRGPSVMMGYARAPQDLAKADEQRGALLTGDLGHLDPDGNLHIDGRVSRICKILDERINLDELERCFADLGDVALAGDDRRITLFHTGTVARARLVGLIDTVVRKVRLPSSLIKDVQVDCIPRTSSGKVSYRDLQEYVSPCDPPKSA